MITGALLRTKYSRTQRGGETCERVMFTVEQIEIVDNTLNVQGGFGTKLDDVCFMVLMLS